MTKHPEFDFDKPDKKKAAELRDQGIDRAMTGAEKQDPGWADKAYKFFVEVFLRDKNGPFMAEEFRNFCAAADILPPKSQRAFGGIMLKARHAGLIRRVAIKETSMPNSHRTPATLWIQVKPSERK